MASQLYGHRQSNSVTDNRARWALSDAPKMGLMGMSICPYNGREAPGLGWPAATAAIGGPRGPKTAYVAPGLADG